MSNSNEIDFVLIWVDSNDPEWQKDKEKYAKVQDKKFNPNNVRYRDWDFLRYWFRGVELYAPWVRKIHFVTCGHTPSWLNLNHSKINFVKHSDYIPSEYLPTFGANPIELNFHRIPELSERFVYFNDDMFLNAPVRPDDFFRDGLPCDSAIRNIPNISRYGHIDLNDLLVIGRHFNFVKQFRKFPSKYLNWRYGLQNLRFLLLSPWPIYCGFKNTHTAFSYLKSTWEEVWAKESDVLNQTCLRKFRDERNVNQYVFRYWQLAKGSFMPRSYSFSSQYCISNAVLDNIIIDIQKRKHKVICLNDNDDLANIEPIKHKIIEAFERVFPEKSSFEI